MHEQGKSKLTEHASQNSDDDQIIRKEDIYHVVVGGEKFG